jgi:hypothetical protein
MFDKQIGNDMCLLYNVHKTRRERCVYRVMFNKRIGNDMCLPNEGQ